MGTVNKEKLTFLIRNIERYDGYVDEVQLNYDADDESYRG